MALGTHATDGIPTLALKGNAYLLGQSGLPQRELSQIYQ